MALEEIAMRFSVHGIAGSIIQITKLTDVTTKLSNNFSLIGTKLNNQVTKPIKRISDALDASISSFTNINNEVMALGKATKLLNVPLNLTEKTIKKITPLAGRFKMELLSVMFGAQMVSGALWGVLQPAMQAAGIFELLSTAMLVLFLPIAVALIDPLVELLNWFVSLPEPLKEFIGAVVLMLASFMTFLATQAAVDLFFGGMLKNFEAMGGMLPGLTSELGKFAKLAAIPIGVYFASETLKAIEEGRFLDAAVNALITGLSFSHALGKISGKTAILIAVGVYFAAETIKDISEGKYLDAMADAMITAGSFLMFKSPHAGGTIIAIGFTLKFIEPLKQVGESVVDWIRNNVVQPIQDAITIQSGGLPSNEYYTKAFERQKKGTFLKPKASYAMGGYIPHTGLYKLHAGETVQQAGASSFSANIVINANSNVDVQMLKSQLSSQWNDELRRLSRG